MMRYDIGRALILLINQIHHQFHHRILLLRLALGDHDGDGHQGVVADAFAAVGAEEHLVFIHEINEEPRRDALVAIGEGVVLHNEVQQVGRFFLVLVWRWCFEGENVRF